MRDVLNVEVQSKDGKAYRGMFTYLEAKHEIFGKALNLTDDLLHGIRIQFRLDPSILFKLVKLIDIDALTSVEHFEFERTVSTDSKGRKEVFT